MITIPFDDYVPTRVIYVSTSGSSAGTGSQSDPLSSIQAAVDKVTPGTTDFSAGPGPKTLHLPGLPPVSPLICYEAIFPHAVADTADRPRWLLNLTNDGWYGITSGPFQHFSIARTRAVEEGMPLVRAANNGVSGLVDPYGRVVRRLGLDAIGYLDVSLPQSLAPTLYERLGDLPFLIALPLLLGLAWGVARMTGRRRESA